MTPGASIGAFPFGTSTGSPLPDASAGRGSIVVGGGGSVAVATATLFSHAQSLEELSVDLSGCRRLVDRYDQVAGAGLLSVAGAPPSAARAEAAIDDATRFIEDARRASEWLGQALLTSADVYGMAEDAMAKVTQSLAGEVARALGFAGTAVGVVMLPFVLAGAAVLGSGYALARAIDPAGTRRGIDRLGRLLDSQRGILTDPAFVAFTRLTVMSTDDLLAGALLIPAPVARTIGDEGMGIIGTDTVAGLVAGVGSVGFGAFRESEVRAVPAAPVAATRATGLAERVDRIPTGDARVRVDRYRMPSGENRYEVYIGGTSDFSPEASTDPFDLTSNVAALSGVESGSYRSVELALADAGVTKDSSVELMGYSQGGLVAAMLAASGDYDVTGLTTLGAPAAQVPVPAEIPWLAVEHTDDLVPAVGGTWTSADPLLVRREAVVGQPDPEHPFSSHGLDLYRETAAMADATDEQRLADWRAQIDAHGRGAVEVVSTSYEVERIRDAAG